MSNIITQASFLPGIENEVDPVFRPIRYLGIKTRALTSIVSTARGIVPTGSTICDLFAGTGVVSYAFSKHFATHSNDIQAYSAVLSEALMSPKDGLDATLIQAIASCARQLAESLTPRYLEGALHEEDSAIADAMAGSPDRLAELIAGGPPSFLPRDSVPLKEIHELRGIVSTELRPYGFLSQHYSHLYFSLRQSIALDALMTIISGVTDKRLKILLLASSLSTASHLSSTIGNQFAQPIKPYDHSLAPKTQVVKKAALTRARDVIETFTTFVQEYATLPQARYPFRAVTGDYRELLNNLPDNISLIYADPPYTRDHYSRFYHVLETMARMDIPAIATNSDGESFVHTRMRSDRHQSPFSIKSQVSAAFSTLFAAARERGVPLLLSYAYSNEGTAARPRPRLMEISQLEALAKGFDLTIEETSAGAFGHSKLNRAHRNSSQTSGTEILLLLQP